MHSTLETNAWFKILRILLYALLLTPLLLWSIFLFPFITTKVLYFRLFVELAFVLYVILAIQHPEIRPRWNWLVKMVWIYVAVMFIASIFGVNFNMSFWSTIERGEGIVSILHYAVYFTILASVFRSQRDWYRYLMAALAVTLVTAFYGLAQFFNFSGVLNTTGARLSGTIGNAAFFAAFMLFGVFLSLYLLQQSKTKWVRVCLWTVFIIELFVLYQTQTRGAILAALVGFFVFFLVSLLKSQSRRLKLVSGILLVALFSGALLVYANRNSNWVQTNGTLSRLVTISSTDITTQSRLDTTKASLQAYKDRPILGWGYENYNIAFNKYFPARIFKDQGSQIWFDRAHNMVLDVLITSGIIGLLAYLGIFLVVIWILWKLFKSPDKDLPWRAHLIIGVLLLTYFLQNLFVFDTPATHLMFFMVLALVASLKDQSQSQNNNLEKSGYEVGYFMPIVLVILMLFVAYFVNIEPAFANYYATQGLKMAKAKNYRDVSGLFKRSLSYGTYMDREIRQRLVDYTNEAIASGMLTPQEQQEFFDFTVAGLTKNLDEHRRDVKNYLYLMSFLNRNSRSVQDKRQVLTLGEEALPLSPTRPQIYFEIGQAEFMLGNNEAGLQNFEMALALSPEPRESHFNLMIAAIVAGREDIVSREWKVITEDYGYIFTAPDLINIGRAHEQADKLDLAVENYEAALALEPRNFDARNRLVGIFRDLCEVEKARIQILQAVELGQVLASDAQSFLQELETKCSNK